MTNSSTNKSKDTHAKNPETETPPQVVESTAKPERKWKFGGIFWGALFVSIGTLFLLDNLGLIDVSFGELWRLWPILVIGAGLSLLSLRGWVATVAAIVLIAVTITSVWLVAIDKRFLPDQDQSQIQSQSVDRPIFGVDSQNVTIKTGATDITLGSDLILKTLEASLKSSGLRLDQTSEVKNRTQYVTLSTEATRDLWFGDFQSDLEVNFNRSLPLDLTIEAGASKLSGDLSGSELSSLKLKMGASDINLTLGDSQDRQTVTIESGVSSVVLRLPKDAGVRVTSDSGLTSMEFQEIEKVNDNLYESKDFSNADTQISISAKLGLSQFKIERY